MSGDEQSAPKCNGVGQGGGKELVLARRADECVVARAGTPLHPVAAELLTRLLHAVRDYFKQKALGAPKDRVAAENALAEAAKWCSMID